MGEDETVSQSSEQPPLGLPAMVLRVAIGLNFLRFLLAFVSGFEEGVGGGPGLADRIFNPLHSNGFRSDFIWLFFSTLAIFGAIFAYLPRVRKDKSARLSVFLSVAWIVAFLIYMARVLSLGLLDFG
jgi:hypothetical protein